MPELFAEIPRRALAVYAHPDDPDVSCGGTIAAWSKGGCEVRILLCTDGGKGTTDPGGDVAALVRQRAAEAREAAAVLGVTGEETLGYPDGELADDLELRRQIVAAVRRHRPEVVLAPDPSAMFFGQEYFNHRDHRVVGLAALDAVAPAAALPLYFPESGPAHQVGTVLLSGTLEADVFVDVSTTIEVKGAAVACHRSQFSEGGDWASAAMRLGAEDAGRQCGVRYAEVFRRIRLGG
ncbi:MAG TPA: PIG-L deacetylase family protein [Acidimicrobiales bacterium]|nr:PIG-L deacetylase family protein [Acidimicrobiales bacterium]